MSQRPDKHARIVVAVERADQQTLEIVQCVYDESIRQLHVLFIENTRLLEHASSSLAREVLASGVERRLDANALLSQWKTQAAQVRHALETMASNLGIPLIFQVARGETIPEARLLPPDTELLVIGADDRSTETVARLRGAIAELESGPFRGLLIGRRGWSSGSSILTLTGDAADAIGIAQLGSRLAKRSASRHMMIARSAAAADALLEIGGTIQVIDELEIDALISAAQRERAKLIVLPWASTREHAELLTGLLQRTDSALLLVK